MRLAAKLAYRRPPLSSNVRQQVVALGCSPPLQEAAVAAEYRIPVFLGVMAFSVTTGLPLWLGGQGACSVGSVSGCFARSNVFTRPSVAGRSSVGSSVLACNWCSRALPSIPSRRAAAQARARLQAAACSVLVVAAPRVGASAVAVQVIACSAVALAPSRGCCLTLRSWGLPPARHLARVAVVLIIGLAGQAPSRRQPLSSNVRPRKHPRRAITAEFALRRVDEALCLGQSRFASGSMATGGVHAGTSNHLCRHRLHRCRCVAHRTFCSRPPIVVR